MDFGFISYLLRNISSAMLAIELVAIESILAFTNIDFTNVANASYYFCGTFLDFLAVCLSQGKFYQEDLSKPPNSRVNKTN